MEPFLKINVLENTKLMKSKEPRFVSQNQVNFECPGLEKEARVGSPFCQVITDFAVF